MRSYFITDLTLKQRLEVIRMEMRRSNDAGEALVAVIIDGLGDLCLDPNDAAESNALIDEMHRLAIEYNTVIVCVLHENPGSDTGKTRGHLGSQLERKAETNLRLEKDAEGITVVFCERARHTHIPKDKGMRFQWSDEAKMHVTTDAPFTSAGKTKKDPNAPRKNDMTLKAKACLGRYFARGSTVRRALVLKEAIVAKIIGERTFDAHWAAIKAAGLIVESPMRPGFFEASPEWAKELAADYPEEDAE